LLAFVNENGGSLVKNNGFSFIIIVLLLCSSVGAGPYSPAAGKPGSNAVSASDPEIVAWATSVKSLVRGPVNISNPGLGAASFGSASDALGQANGTSLVSLGDGGSITVGFDQPIANGPGADFAVFENGLASGSAYFLELGFVEVSSDGTNFFRFPDVSLTPSTTQVSSFGVLDPTNLYDLAGNFVAGFGTPFDLQELNGVSPLLDVNDVQYVRVVDVVGSVNPLYATHDSLGNIVNDPWPTPFASGGFDFDAVGVINQVPEPAAWVMAGIGGVSIFLWKRRRRK
jgi:hypothetical protein